MSQLDWTQRWTLGTSVARPAAEPFDPSRFEVGPVDHAPARAFVEAHHYSRSYPATRFRFGLWQGQRLVGVAAYSVPVSDRVLTRVFPCPVEAATELGRLVLLDEVPGNAESWFVAECHRRLAREGIEGVLSMSDPTPRYLADGTILHPGHVGVVYQALNGIYLGRATPRTVQLLADGRPVNGRRLQKVRAGERGAAAAEAALVEAGAAPRQPGEDPRTWLKLALAQTTRKLRHPGNHRYAWGLSRAMKRHLPQSLPFPEPPGGRPPPAWGRRAKAA